MSNRDFKLPITEEHLSEFKKLFAKYPNGIQHILLPGHGGLSEDGQYNILVPGSKQARVDGKLIFEGVINRKISRRVHDFAHGTFDVVNFDSVRDIPLKERVDWINDIVKQNKEEGKTTFLWELHTNAFNGQATGTEIFTTKKNNLSDALSAIWLRRAKEIISLYHKGWKWREDYSDDQYGDKEADFYVIKNAHCYGVLIEFFFFDNRKDLQTFNHPLGWSQWASTLLGAFHDLEKIFNMVNPEWDDEDWSKLTK